MAGQREHEVTLRLLVGSVVRGFRPAFLGAGFPSPGEWPSSEQIERKDQSIQESQRLSISRGDDEALCEAAVCVVCGVRGACVVWCGLGCFSVFPPFSL